SLLHATLTHELRSSLTLGAGNSRLPQLYGQPHSLFLCLLLHCLCPIAPFFNARHVIRACRPLLLPAVSLTLCVPCIRSLPSCSTPAITVSLYPAMQGEGKALRASHLLRDSNPGRGVAHKQYREKSMQWISLLSLT